MKTHNAMTLAMVLAVQFTLSGCYHTSSIGYAGAAYSSGSESLGVYYGGTHWPHTNWRSYAYHSPSLIYYNHNPGYKYRFQRKRHHYKNSGRYYHNKFNRPGTGKFNGNRTGRFSGNHIRKFNGNRIGRFNGHRIGKFNRHRTRTFNRHQK